MFRFSHFFIFFLISTVSTNKICDFFESQSTNITTSCLKQLQTVCNNPSLIWKLYDASSKLLTSGMTYSNVIDFGNFPECLSINYQDNNGIILGKFCAFSVNIINVFLTPQNEKIFKNFGIDTNPISMQLISKNTFMEIEPQLRDVLLPDIPFVISKYSSCVPDACTPKEVADFYLYGQILANDNFIKLMYYTDLPCETVNSNTHLETKDIVVGSFLGVILVLLIASTTYEVLYHNFRKKPNDFLLSFSVLSNGRKLLHVSTNKDQIEIFNGMRFISMMWVIAYHAALPFGTGVIGLENFPEAKQWSQNIASQYIYSGLLAVVTFIYISGFLLAFTYLKNSIDQSVLKQIKKIPKMYLNRYIRLTPSVGVMFLVTISIFRLLGSGPVWSLVNEVIRKPCIDKWWKFFLYIQNYTDPDDMCLVPTWYLSADMQMFLLAPLVLIPTARFVKKNFNKVMSVLIALIVVSIFIPMIIRLIQNEAGNIYTAHERFNNFLIGIAFGTFMRLYKNERFMIHSIVNFILWVMVLTISIMFNLYWNDILVNYELTKYALFMAMYRPIWCLFLSFMVYSCYHNQGGIIQWFLSRPAFQILGRLSYSMYVLHYLVEIYSVAKLRTNLYFSNYFLFYYWCGHFIVTMVLSVVWIFAFEFPMLTIGKYLLQERKSSKRK